jgi:hypothetical protein
MAHRLVGNRARGLANSQNRKVDMDGHRRHDRDQENVA